jgi:PAS domain S-box-containing protein
MSTEGLDRTDPSPLLVPVDGPRRTGGTDVPAWKGETPFRAVLENAPIGMALVALDGRWGVVNRALCRITGYPEEELVRLTYHDVTHPADITADLENVRRLLAGETSSYEMEKRYLRRDGSEVWVLLSVALMRGPDGAPLYFITQVQDISARKAAETALRYSEAKLAGIVSLSTDGIVSVDDAMRITLFNQGAERIYGYAAEEVLEQPLEMLVPQRFRRTQAAQLRAFAEEAAAAGPGAQPRHARIVGLRRDGGEFVAEASVSQLAIGGTRLLTAVVRDITERERRQERERLLAEAGRVLAASLEYEESLRSVVEVAVPDLADWCVLDLLDGGAGPRAAETAAADPERRDTLRELLAHYPEAVAPGPRVDVVDRGRPLLFAEVPEERFLAGARDERHRALLRRLEPRSAMVVPLVARGRVFGSLTLAASESGRRYGVADLALAEELGRRAALAIDNARLYRAAREARAAAERAAERMERLQHATAAFAGALTPAGVAEVVIREGVAAFGADAGVMVMTTPDGTELEVLASAGLAEPVVERWRRFSVDTPLPLAEAVRTRECVLVTGRDALAARFPLAVEPASAAGHHAWAAAPLLADHHALGAIGLSFTEARDFSADDRDFLGAIAAQCAGALERARLYEGERRARAQAEAATRARDELLGVVAHDLRNPLTAISMYASLLLDAPRDPESQRAPLRSVLELTDQMNRLIHDLLDASRLESGQLRVHPGPLAVRTVLAEAREMVRLAAEKRGVEIVLDVPGGLPRVLADRDRLLQVLSNLVGNAVKFTPRGGRVTLRAGGADGELAFAVSDTGVGIPAEQLPRVFDRYWQADARRTGAGLGLAIARGIVEAHGGRIWVDSAPGEGSTFSFTLPAAPPA